jgi:hypothetical protein
MKYKLTDGRPWYKQVVSGVYLSALVLVIWPIGILVAGGLLYLLYSNFEMKYAFFWIIMLVNFAIGIYLYIWSMDYDS